MTQKRGLGVACAAALMAAGVAKAAPGVEVTITAQPAWSAGAPVVGRVLVQAPGGAAVVLRSDEPGDLFGFASLAVADVDGDGVQDVAVSAPLMVGAEERHGCVYLFSGASGEKLGTLWGAPNERFGTGLDVFPDGDGDGIADLRVGAMGRPGVDPVSKTRLVETWRAVSSVGGAELDAGGLEELPSGVLWHAVADDELGMTGVIRDASAADLDADGEVSENDFLQLVELVARTQVPGGVGVLGDVNGDGAVNSGDISSLVAQVGLPPSDVNWEVVPGSAQSLPSGPGIVLRPKRPPGGTGGDGSGSGGPGDGGGTTIGGGGGGGGGGGDDDDDDDGGDGGPGDGGDDDDEDDDSGGGGGGSDNCQLADSDADGIRDEDDCDHSPAEDPDCCTPDSPWGRAQNNPENLTCWAPHRPLVDIDVDTDNTSGLNRPERTQEEERLEDLPDALGKVLLINNNDDDGDGIPDFADGYDRDNEADSDDESALGDAFAPVVVRLTCSAVLEYLEADPEVKIKFSYMGSDPSEVEVYNGANGPEYMPAPGVIRLWTKDASEDRDPREVSDGGDWIKPGVEYEISDVGFGVYGRTITLYAEGIAPGRADIHVQYGRFWDRVPLSVVGYRFVRATENGAGGEMSAPLVSTPTPVIRPIGVTLHNVRASPNGAQILGTLGVALSVSDAASDLIDGSDGVIRRVEMSLNDKPVQWVTAPLTGLDLQVSKETESSILRPFPYRGSVYAELPNVVLEPGVNVLKFTARNAHGGVGFLEKVFEVSPVAPPDESFAFSLHSGAGMPVPGAAMQSEWIFVEWTYSNGAAARTGEATLFPTSSPGVYRDGNSNQLVLGSHEGMTTATLSLAPDGSGAWPAITRDTYVLDQPVPTIPRFEGGGIIESFQRETWFGYNFSIQTVLVRASSGGSFNPMLIEIVGTDEIREKISQFTIAEHSYEVVHELDRTFLRAASVTRPRAFILVPTRDGPLTSFDHDPRRDGPLNFAKGFGIGLLDGGVSFVDGMVQLADGAWYIIANYNSFSVGYRIAVGEDVILVEDQRRLQVAWDVASQIAVKVGQIAAQEADTLYRALHGDESAINALGEDFRVAYDLAAEITEGALDHLTGLSDFDKGRVMGAIMGEALAETAFSLATGGGGAVLKSASIPRIIVKLRGKLPANLLTRIEPRLVAAGEHAAELAQSVLCFPAGTLVLTPSGYRLIESIGVGEIVISRDPNSDAQDGKPVIAQIRSVADDTLLIRIALPTGPESILETTGAHPFYSISRCAFVPADQLCVGEVLESVLPGVHAHVVDIQVARGPPKGQVVYNLMVADFHTYFVGDAGVWVHNAADTPCQRVASIFERVARRANLRGMQALEAFLEATDSAARRAVVDGSLRKLLRVVARESLEDAISENGVVDLARIKTHDQMQEWLAVGDRAQRVRASDTHNHHLVPKYVIRYLIKARHPELDWDQVEALAAPLYGKSPSILLHHHDHIGGAGDGEAAFHAILNRGDMLHPVGRPRGFPYDYSDITTALEETYIEWGEPAAIPVLRAWIHQNVPGGD